MGLHNYEERSDNEMKKSYIEPSIDTMEYAQFENVFTYCDRNPAVTNCINVTGSGHDADKPPGLPEEDTTSHQNLPFGNPGFSDLDS